jgi:S1-C subfamily serine protease/poly(3-hydroxybutyrate) depolymerase
VGIISARNRIWGKAIQTDAKVSPTNYGGPLVDLHGRVMGVLVPASPQAEGETVGFEWYDSGIGFAVPLEDINAVLPRLMKGTAKDPVVLKRGLLGITPRDQDLYAAAPVIGTIAPGSAAEKAGLKAGDVIKEVAGKPVLSQAQLMHQLGSRYEGEAVALTVQRGKEEIKLDKVVLAGTAAYGQAFLGILPVRDDPGPGVEVRYVFAKSPADRAGLKEGDRIMKVGRQAGPGRPTLLRPLTGREQLTGLMETAVPGWEIKAEVRRKGEKKKTEVLTVTLGGMPDEVPEKLPERASAGKALAVAAARPAGEGKKDDKEDKKPETGLLKRTTAAADHTYWVFVPDNYDPNIAHALVIWLHPAGKGRDKDFDDLTDSWQPYCEDNHVIMVCPRTENERGWTPAEADFIQEAVRAVSGAYTIDRRRVVAHGMGLGGEMAFYLGFHNRQLIRGVATVGAPLTSNPKERVVNQPLAFFLVAGAKDPLSKVIRESRAKLSDHKYPVIYREVPDMGHQYIDGKNGLPTLEELVRWIDALDRL